MALHRFISVVFKPHTHIIFLSHCALALSILVLSPPCFWLTEHILTPALNYRDPAHSTDLSLGEPHLHTRDLAWPSQISLSSLTNPRYGFAGSFISSSGEGTVFFTRQGLPTATENGGISFVTIDPAPIVEPRPMRTPGRMTTFPPIQQSSSMKTGCPNSTNFWRERTLVSCPALKMLTFVPIWTRSPITTRLVSRIVKLPSLTPRDSTWITGGKGKRTSN